MNSKIILVAIIAIVVSGSALIYSTTIFDQEQNKTQSVIMPDMSAFTNNNQSKFFKGTQEIKKISTEKELQELLLEALRQEMALDELSDHIRHGGVVALDSQAAQRVQSEPVPAPEPEPMVEPSRSVEESPRYSGSEEVEHSTTNVQVQGVDEPDYIKNDGKYVYLVYQNILTILDAYPPESAETILKVALDVRSQDLENIFLNDDRLLIFYHDTMQEEIIPEYEYEPRRWSYPVTHAMILDVSDRKDPEIINDYSIDGRFTNARMIGDFAYVVTEVGVDHSNPIVPMVRESSRIIVQPEMFYFDNFDRFSNFVTITSLDMFGDAVDSESFLMGSSGTLYASTNGFYLTYKQNLPHAYHDSTKQQRFFDVVVPLLPEDIQNQIKEIQDDQSLDWYQKWNLVSDTMQDAFNKMEQNQKEKLFELIEDRLREYDFKVQQESRKTVIHKITIDKNDGTLEYDSRGAIPGWLLNQFSMDEHDGKLRVATTNEFYERNRGTTQYNSVYVLDQNLEQTGKLEKIALDERIYSARFIDDRLYLVTFKQIDPFFVIDLSSNDPKVLGELKIPGFSNYLHPYDEDHILGIGRDTIERKGGGVSQLGIKIAMFDVSNVSNPSVLDEVVIGDRRTNSRALDDHKAFLFDNEKNILSIPIHGPQDELKVGSVVAPDNARWFGYYVFGVGLAGFEPRGTIDHTVSRNYQFSDIEPRSFYIGDVLYTVSDHSMKMNDINDISEINSIQLQRTGKLVEHLK